MEIGQVVAAPRNVDSGGPSACVDPVDHSAHPTVQPKNIARMIVVGLTSGSRAELDMGTILRKRLKMIGTTLRARSLEEKIALARDVSEHVIPLFDTGKLRPVVDRVLRFEEIRSAHELMHSNETFGKIVLRWE